jgi:hypothetical protein
VQRLVRVLLRIDDPDEQVNELDEAIDLEPVVELGGVVIGQVEQDQAVELLLVLDHRAVLPGRLPTRDAEPLNQRRRSLGTPDAGVRLGGGRTPYADR